MMAVLFVSNMIILAGDGGDPLYPLLQLLHPVVVQPPPLARLRSRCSPPGAHRLCLACKEEGAHGTRVDRSRSSHLPGRFRSFPRSPGEPRVRGCPCSRGSVQGGGACNRSLSSSKPGNSHRTNAEHG